MNTKSFVVRTGIKAGISNFSGTQTAPGAPGRSNQYGWWWLPGGYIARPGGYLKQYMGWWYGPAPKFYYPAMGAGAAASPGLGAGAAEGQMAPPAP